MKLDFTPEELKNYFNGETKHVFYKQSVEISEEIHVHVTGEYPEKLLEERRPHEPEEVKCYRKKIWEPITKPIVSKVITSLSKIRRSADWSINFEDPEQFTRIPEDERLNDYIETKFPYFTSLTNWVFDIYLRQYASDPNGVVVVMPLESDIEENDFLKPFPTFFKSELVLDFIQEDYAVLENPEGSEYRSGNSIVLGKSFYIITSEKFQRWDQINGHMKFEAKVDYPHGLGFLPVFKAGGLMIDSKNIQYLYESRLSAMIPHLNEAAREYSDLQAAIVLHLYPERWEYTQSDCIKCNGTGKARVIGEEPTSCSECNGHGKKLTSPYGKILVYPTEAGSQPAPSPPAGFIEKDVEIIKLQDERIEAHKYAALAAINMEFLAKTPLSESGVAKEVDRDELNNFVNSIAEDVVKMMDNIIYTSAVFRYSVQYSIEDIKKMVPMIPVPEKFDMLSSRHLEEDVKSAKENKLNPVLLNAIEIDYATKKFNTDPGVRDELLLILQLDPLPNVSEDEKMTRLSNKGITLESYIISCNIHEFIQRAIEEDPKFIDKEVSEQKKVIQGYAKAQASAETAKAKVLEANTLEAVA